MALVSPLLLLLTLMSHAVKSSDHPSRLDTDPEPELRPYHLPPTTTQKAGSDMGTPIILPVPEHRGMHGPPNYDYYPDSLYPDYYESDVVHAGHPNVVTDYTTAEAVTETATTESSLEVSEVAIVEDKLDYTFNDRLHSGKSFAATSMNASYWIVTILFLLLLT